MDKKDILRSSCMGVDEKVAEAEYFQKRLKEAYPRDEFKFELSAFLSSARSVVDYLLEEYNQKCSLGITSGDMLTIPAFKAQATNTGNSNAITFIAWYEPQVSRLGNDPVGRVIFSRRNLNIHRSQGSMNAKVEIHEHITISESVMIVVKNEKGQVVDIRKSEDAPRPGPKRTESRMSWYFDNLPADEIPSVCEKYLNMIKKLVKDTRKTFP
jgi:hypothetical protein